MLVVGVVGVALLWWFATGSLLFLGHLPRTVYRWAFVASTALLVVALAGLAWVAPMATPAGAVLSFLFGFLAWSWQEVGFYSGIVTGPRTVHCRPGCRGWRHFGHALQACLYHEVGIVLSAGLVALATSGGANRVGLWTFLLMWGLHESARINVFLGVRNVSASFLPPHLDHIRSFLSLRSRPGAAMAISLLASTGVAAALIVAALAAPSGTGTATGLALLATMGVVGVLEHLMLILPLPETLLWGWAVPRGSATASAATQGD